MRQADADVVVFRSNKTLPLELDEKFNGSLQSFRDLLRWTYPKCFSLVREITFENAEAITEEGVPLIILFYNPNNKPIIQSFNEVIEKLLRNDSYSYLRKFSRINRRNVDTKKGILSSIYSNI